MPKFCRKFKYLILGTMIALCPIFSKQIEETT